MRLWKGCFPPFHWTCLRWVDSRLPVCFLNIPFKVFRCHTTSTALLYGVTASRSTKGLVSLPLCLCLSVALLVFCQRVGPPVLLRQPFLSHLRKSSCWVGRGPVSVSVSQETLQIVKRIFSYLMTWQSVRLCHVETVDYRPQDRPKCLSLGVCTLSVRTDSGPDV